MAKRARFQIPDYPRDRPTVDKVKPLVKALEPYNYYESTCERRRRGEGFCLHIVLDDRNIGTDSIRWCLEEWGCCPACAEVARMMLQMTKTQRRCL